MQKHSMLIMTGLISVSIILTGCFKGEQSLDEEMDPPKRAEEVEKQSDDEAVDNESAKDKETSEEAVDRQLFLIDADGKVAPQTVDLPKDDSMAVASQALEYLVKDGPVQNVLPNGFQAVIPANTEINSVDLKDDSTLVVDVSEEFENYEEEDEQNILEAMTFTVTQFDSVDKMKLEINGEPQDEMPVDETPIGDGYSRANGINLMETDTVDLIDSEAVTMYYPTEFNESEYFVPVTQHVSTEKDEDVFSSIVQALIDGPGYDINSAQVFNSDVSLASKPTLDDGVLNVVFNNEVLKNKDKMTISDDVMETLVRTLTEQEDVQAVNVEVENADKLFNENGEAYSEPITRDMVTNTEKL